ncbi:hypothetical protein ETB97_008687 [Aspergillus alliaceus]|uniref:Zn(2)-C6 fungal-type domain-containing protein n=1 Tax=Petromyces alliaceus TaxID=209559 RepID=A0A8H6ECE1_PETAA|nr:hypothetical protein ETB97_008687 [Aspergillus burnettii]
MDSRVKTGFALQEKATIRETSKNKTKGLPALFAGACAGATEITITYPFESAKTRAQLERRLGKEKLPSVKPGIRGWYAGYAATVTGTAVKAAVQFSSFHIYRSALAGPNGELSTAASMIAGFGAGVTEAVLAVTPAEAIKTKINAAVKFTVYSELMGAARRYSGKDVHPLVSTLVGSVTGVCCAWSTQPLDVIKTRMQSLQARQLYGNAFRCASILLRQEGIGVFWSGVLFRTARLSLTSAIMFPVYEKVYARFGSGPFAKTAKAPPLRLWPSAKYEEFGEPKRSGPLGISGGPVEINTEVIARAGPEDPRESLSDCISRGEAEGVPNASLRQWQRSAAYGFPQCNANAAKDWYPGNLAPILAPRSANALSTDCVELIRDDALSASSTFQLNDLAICIALSPWVSVFIRWLWLLLGQLSESLTNARPPPNAMCSDEEAAQRRYMAACDECRVRKIKCHKDKAHPKCSLCLKQSLPCLYTNKSKRVNHTTKLVRDVEQLGNRLGKIEIALERYLSFMGSPKHNLDASGSQTGDSIRLLEHSTPNLLQGPGHTAPAGDQAREPPFGPSSIPSLCAEAQATCEKLASSLDMLDAGEEKTFDSDSNTSSLLFNVAQANKCMQYMIQEVPLSTGPGDDGVTPTLPPRTLLEASIQPYFTYISSFLPIYERETVIAAISDQYAADSPDLVWIISFNSIALQALDAKLVAAKDIESIGYGGILEDALLYQLRMNLRRCYCNLEKLAHPSLVNAQALLSMASVALKYFHYNIFETVFVQACQVSRSIGLHRRSTKERETHTEQTNVFWSLFIVDKHAAFISGKACLLPSYDCSVALPYLSSNQTLAEYFAARIRLSYLLEQLYQVLYSADATGKEWRCMGHQARKVSRQLDDWATEHEHLLWPDPSSGFTQQAFCARELRHALSTCQLLLHRRTEVPGSEIRLQSARTCLSLFKEVCETYGLLEVSGFGVFDSVSSSSMCLSTGGNEAQLWNTHPHAVGVPFDTAMMNVAPASSVNYSTLLDGSTSYIEELPFGLNSPRLGQLEGTFDGLQGFRWDADQFYDTHDDTSVLQ